MRRKAAKEAHIGGWNKRITDNRSLKIERDESPTQM